MKKLLFLLILVGYLTANAQTTPGLHTVSSGYKTEEAVIKDSKTTTLVYEGNKVYQATNGKLFIIRKSKKTGNYYKVELQKD